MARRRIRCYFNSRPHKEVDRIWLVPETSGLQFQFTTSQGGRPGAVNVNSTSAYFNSRPYKEVDLSVDAAISELLAISIHDLTRRSTGFDGYNDVQTRFQFTTSQGGRHGAQHSFQQYLSFQFTTSQGGRRIIFYLL